jgi:hypothetical protein
MLSTATTSTETSMSTLRVGGGMSSGGVTTMTASSTVPPAMTSAGIHWRREYQESCHYQRPQR